MYEINLTTLRLIKDHIEMQQSVTKEDVLLRSLIMGASSMISRYLDRNIKREQRTDYLDCKDDQQRLYLRGWPVALDGSGVPLIEIWNDYNIPPTYDSTTKLVQGEDFIVYPDERDLGLVRFYCTLTGNPKALKVVSTAGMATKTSVEGSDGMANDPGGGANNRLTSASATFVTDEVVAGDLLQMYSNTANQGLYEIVSVDDETNILVSPEFAQVGGAAEQWGVITAGLVGRYSDLATAANLQVAYWYKMKDTPEVKQITIAGTSTQISQTTHTDVTKNRAQGLLPVVQSMVERLRLPEVLGVYRG